MAGIDSALAEWLEEVKHLADLTPKEQANITKAGADVFKSELEKETKKRHYSSHKNSVYGHMADNLAVQAKNIDGRMTGVSTVGWNNPYHASNARRLNDGTKKYKADHFVTNVQDSQVVQARVLQAEKEAYERVIEKKR
ncbi:HK97 gp10 family phage protein [Streptococcus sp. SQ9-PEA]|uniref:HK97 gp10 family phage protein n=2 Tax=Streptococcus sciuri TaxID=2973939 RepID=A0ABT2F7H5_9STRE|nr:HK97 gp10 family phage protein [Streptococcus sciuri]